MIDDAEALIDLLDLRPLEIEGGWFRETYQSGASVETANGTRPLATAIYYLLTPQTFSELHRLPGDEVYHFYLGDAVQMVHLHPDGTVVRLAMGTNMAAGEMLQFVVPGGTWQASRLRPGGRFALLGTTMSPGFSFEDYERGERIALMTEFPAASEDISRLTRSAP